MLGFESQNDEHVTVLKRLIDIQDIAGVPTIAYEPDPRHIGLLIEQMGLQDNRSKGFGTRGEMKSYYFDETDATLYRSGMMRLGYVGADCSDLQFASN